MNKISVIMASSECEPLAKTGGMADVVSALSKELLKLNVNVMIFLPFYKQIREVKNIKLKNLHITTKIRINSFYKEASFFQTTLPYSSIPVYLIKNDEYFFRDQLYSVNGSDYPDNLDRFILFNKALLNFILLKEIKVHLIHCHDWQASLLSVYLKLAYSYDNLLNNIKTLFTIHNFSYQGIFDINEFHKLNLNWDHFTSDKMEYFGKINLLKSALNFSDSINTVSETYKNELLNNTNDISAGLTSILRAKKNNFFGILNGADYSLWDPARDRYISTAYSASGLNGKMQCKKDLLKSVKLTGYNAPLLIMISRLVMSKGLDILIPVMEKILRTKVNLIILGEGDIKIREKYLELEKKFNNFKFFYKFDEALAHKMQAGADILLMPSHSEPCGLNQIYSLKYGTVPVVYHTGGLADTIIDYNKNKKNGTGFVFYQYDSKSLLQALSRALKIYKSGKEWDKIRINGMNRDFSWERSAHHYLDLYFKMIQ